MSQEIRKLFIWMTVALPKICLVHLAIHIEKNVVIGYIISLTKNVLMKLEPLWILFFKCFLSLRGMLTVMYFMLSQHQIHDQKYQKILVIIIDNVRFHKRADI